MLLLPSALKSENFRYAEADYNLGRLYAARGQSDLAVRAWRRALLVDPKHTAARQALARGEDEPEITVEKASETESPKSAISKSVKSDSPKGLRSTCRKDSLTRPDQF